MSDLSVCRIAPVPQPPPLLRAYSIDHATVDTRHADSELVIEGWALGAERPVIAIEAVHEQLVVARVPAGIARRDVQSTYTSEPAASTCGFSITIQFVSQPSLEIIVRAVLADQHRAVLGTINVQHQSARTPTVSVVIPCFNQGRFLGDAIHSVVEQADADIEVIVLDDASFDNTYRVARQWPGTRCHRLPHGGVSRARNLGLNLSEGEFVIFLDADDRLLPSAVSTGVSILRERPTCAWTFGRFRTITIAGQRIQESQPLLLGDDPYAALLRGQSLTTTAAGVFRRSAVCDVGAFNPDLSQAEDYDLYLRVSRSHHVFQHDAMTSEYRRHGASASRDREAMLQAVLRVLRSQGSLLANSRWRLAREEGVLVWQRRLGFLRGNSGD